MARQGGDELVVLLPGRDRAEALSLAEQCRQSVEQIYSTSRRITASFGVATITPYMSDANELLDSVDRAMYGAKRRGGNRINEAG